MFQNWGFLLAELWFLLLLAVLLGILVGWLIWGRGGAQAQSDAPDHSVELARLQSDLAACREAHDEKDARILAMKVPSAPTPQAAVAPALPATPIATPLVTPEEGQSETTPDFDGDGVLEGTEEGQKPVTLTAARDGGADDLKMIKGIGPKLETLCNDLGFYHFDQIAAWTDQEVAWVDANLMGFKGRVSRDEWVAQAKLLAAGG